MFYKLNLFLEKYVRGLISKIRKEEKNEKFINEILESMERKDEK